MSGDSHEECAARLVDDLAMLAGVYDDPALAEYVRSVGKRVVAASDRPGIEYRFVVLDEPLPQGLATPTGLVLVTRGVLACLQSEAELAAILAHEVAHVAARDADFLIGAFLQAVGDVVSGLTPAQVLEHDRDHERQADYLAVSMLRRTDYDVRAVASMMRAIYRCDEEDDEEQEEEDGSFAASTHPPLAARLARIERAVDGETSGELRVTRYRRHIEGMVVGHDPRAGVVRDGRFERTRAGFGFAIPAGYHQELDEYVAQQGDPARSGPR